MARGGHHDGPEAQQRALVNGFFAAFALDPLIFQCEVDHHDCVLLNDIHQHDDADERAARAGDRIYRQCRESCENPRRANMLFCPRRGQEGEEPIPQGRKDRSE